MEATAAHAYGLYFFFYSAQAMEQDYLEMTDAAVAVAATVSGLSSFSYYLAITAATTADAAANFAAKEPAVNNIQWLPSHHRMLSTEYFK